jgi:hypothetical protein
VDVLLEPPFSPAQVVAVDISKNVHDRSENQAKVDALRRRFGPVPIVMIFPETLGDATVVYRMGVQESLFEGGRRAARRALGLTVGPIEPAMAGGRISASLNGLPVSAGENALLAHVGVGAKERADV